MIVSHECKTCDCVWRAVCVLQGSCACGQSRTESLASVRAPRGRGMLGSSTAALCSLAVPGKTRLATAGAEFSAHGETKRTTATTAVVCSSASAPVCLAAMRAASCLCRARPCLFILFILPLGRNCSTPLNFHILCSVDLGWFLLPLSMGCREIDQSFCAY